MFINIWTDVACSCSILESLSCVCVNSGLHYLCISKINRLQGEVVILGHVDALQSVCLIFTSPSLSNSEKTSLPGLYPPEETAVCFFTLRCSSSFASLLFNSDHCFRIKAPNSVHATHSGSLLDVVVLTRCREPARWSSSARAASSTSPPRSLCACFVG